MTRLLKKLKITRLLILKPINMGRSKYVLACGLSKGFFHSDGSLYYHNIYDTFDEAFNTIDVHVEVIYDNRYDDEYGSEATEYYYKFMSYSTDNGFLKKPIKVFYKSYDGKYLYAIIETKDPKCIF